MRVSNRLEFTENHRYVAYRDFALSGLERKLLTRLYQPMIGAFAVGLYLLLYHHLEDDRTGYSVPEPQRRLFLGLDLEPNAAGRQALIEQASRLEAVGLAQVFRQYDPATEETLYEYALLRPLAPGEFFSNMHLTLLLRDKLGKVALLELKDELVPAPPVGLARFMNREDVTMPFYELFSLSAAPVDPELETALTEIAPAREKNGAPSPPERIRHSEMLLRFPRGSANRGHVERLHRQPETMAQLNFLAYKFDLDVPDVCRLLDEDGLFAGDGTLRWDELQHRANLVYRQGRKRGEERERRLSRSDAAEAEGTPEEDAYETAMPSTVQPLDIPERFRLRVSVDTYNAMLRREPYTRLLERFFPGTVPDAYVRAFERIDLNYKLPEPVINVLIHYILGMDHTQRLTVKFIDSVASNMLAKGIDTFEKAVAYVRSQVKLNETLERRRRGEDDAARGQAAGSGRSRGSAGSGARRKPAMPVVEDRGAETEIPAEELEKMRELARKLKNPGKS
ncbi:DnaD domain protein [Cohnella zeiphila]|uniref:DnaD domain protein n=1 Tax=Cohnella zeiphila TaxID=2761120 RepID=A0A7X0SMB7_9BACL|nr:DnaD domain protein [Cohnella zeiphila]MBB6732506.1 DnaD domain protein [Cohnella zeiphila]